MKSLVSTVALLLISQGAFCANIASSECTQKIQDFAKQQTQDQFPAATVVDVSPVLHRVSFGDSESVSLVVDVKHELLLATADVDSTCEISNLNVKPAKK